MTVEGLDLAAIQPFFEKNVPGTSGELRATLIAGGKSNLTYRVTDGVNDWVLRRPPLGPLTPTAHDMAREYRVIDALRDTDVPVATAIALCEDESVLGVPFAVSSFVDGRTLQDGGATELLTSAEACRCSGALVDVLARLHSVPFEQVGLANFGRPDGYLARQVKRWRGQWDLVATRELPALQALHELLAASVPTRSDAAIVHGDYRLDNTIVDRQDAGKVLAVVDWEMATLGDPLADLGLMLVYWDPASEPVLGVRHATSANAGFHTAGEVAERYALATGSDLYNLPFYLALGYFKLAVVAEGVHQRYLAGRTIGSGFETIGDAVPVLVDCGLAALTSDDAVLA